MRKAPDPMLQPLLDELRRLADQAARERPLLLTHDEAAAFVGVSRSGWYRLVAGGQVRAVNVPGVGPRFRRADLERYVSGLKPSRRRAKAETVEA